MVMGFQNYANLPTSLKGLLGEDILVDVPDMDARVQVVIRTYPICRSLTSMSMGLS